MTDHTALEAELRAGLTDLADAAPSLRSVTRLDQIDARVARQLHRSTQRRHLLVGAAAATTVAAGGGLTWALTRSDDRSRRPQRVTAADPTTTTITASSAADWQKIPPAPLSERTNPVVVWAGDRLIVWGGDVYPAGDADPSTENLHPLDGVSWVPGSDTWTPIAPAPAGMLSGGLSVWGGTEMFVGPTEADPEAPWNADAPEEHAGYGIAAYEPAADRWRYVIALPLITEAPLDSGRQAVLVRDRLVIAPTSAGMPGSGLHDDDVMVLDLRTGDIAFLKPGPFAQSPYGDASGTVALTAVGDQVLATTSWDRQPWALNSSGTWVRTAPAPPSASSHLQHPLAIGDEAYFSESLDDLPPLAYDLRGHAPGDDIFRDPWRRLTANPVAPAPWDHLPVWTGEEVLVPGAAHDPVTNRWREVRPPPEGRDRQRTLRSSWTGEALLLFGGEEFTCPDSATCDRNLGPDTLDGWLLPRP